MSDDHDAELRSWAFLHVGGVTVAVGRVFSDRKGRWPDGHMIRTSALTGNTGTGEVIATLNTRYLLAGPPMSLKEVLRLRHVAANGARKAKIADEERLFDLLQAAWGMDDQTFEAVAGLPDRWLWQWRNHYRSPTDDDLARVRRLARYHDALRIISYDAPNYAGWWRRRWGEDSIIGARSPLEVVLEEPGSMLDKLEAYFWAQM